MEVKLAQKCGFCFGVKRAINIAEASPNASTIGPLIHNELEIQRLKKDFNVNTLHNISEAKDIKKAIIRTHGITKQDLAKLNEDSVEVVDATCPYVKKPQKICERLARDGYHIIIFGDKNHPEVKGVVSYAGESVEVVLNTDEIKMKDFEKKVGLISQTTKKVEEFFNIANYLEKNYKEVKIFNTICNATFENQDSARELSANSDIMIIIGGKNSSNTKQLYYICKENCHDSYLIESENDLDEKWFLDKKSCGVTAGASTPSWVVDKIIMKIRKIKV